MKLMVANSHFELGIEQQHDCLCAVLIDRKAGRAWGPAPLLELEIYSKAEFRSEAVRRYRIDLVEQCERLLAQLADPDLEALASAKLEGYTNEEIAQRLGCSVRTVERQLHLIRKKWKHEGLP